MILTPYLLRSWQVGAGPVVVEAWLCPTQWRHADIRVRDYPITWISCPMFAGWFKENNGTRFLIRLNRLA